MKKILLISMVLGLGWGNWSAATAQSKVLLKLNLTNTIDLSRKDAPIELPLKKYGKFLSSPFVIKDGDGKELAYQWLTEGTGHTTKLLFHVDLDKKQDKTISFESGKPSVFVKRTYARAVPERYGDFAWENDKIAYRMYGKALEKIPDENASGLDVWAKRTPGLVIDKWYKTADYHHDHGEGLDFYKVAFTLGAGDVLPFWGDSLNYLGNYVSSKIIDSGALRTTFQLDYPAVKKGDITISATKFISFDAGSQMNKETVVYHYSGSSKIPVFAGVVHWNSKKGTKSVDTDKHLAFYWEAPQGKNGSIGVAVYFPEGKNVEMLDVAKHVGGKFNLKNDEKFSYYNGAAWSKAGEITSAEAWKSYVTDFKTETENPIKIKIVK